MHDIVPSSKRGDGRQALYLYRVYGFLSLSPSLSSCMHIYSHLSVRYQANSKVRTACLTGMNRNGSIRLCGSSAWKYVSITTVRHLTWYYNKRKIRGAGDPNATIGHRSVPRRKALRSDSARLRGKWSGRKQRACGGCLNRRGGREITCSVYLRSLTRSQESNNMICPRMIETGRYYNRHPSIE